MLGNGDMDNIINGLSYLACSLPIASIAFCKVLLLGRQVYHIGLKSQYHKIVDNFLCVNWFHLHRTLINSVNQFWK